MLKSVSVLHIIFIRCSVYHWQFLVPITPILQKEVSLCVYVCLFVCTCTCACVNACMYTGVCSCTCVYAACIYTGGCNFFQALFFSEMCKADLGDYQMLRTVIALPEDRSSILNTHMGRLTPAV